MGFKVRGYWCRGQVLNVRIWGVWFWVESELQFEGSGLRVEGLGLGVRGSGVSVRD